MDVDPFELLGLRQRSCTTDDARAAFRSLSLLVHPDKGGCARDMCVVTRAHRYVQRCIANGEALLQEEQPSFREFCDGDMDADEAIAEGATDADADAPRFDVARFNQMFEAERVHAVYLGPATDDPVRAGVVKMAAGAAGAGEGYGDSMLPSAILAEHGPDNTYVPYALPTPPPPASAAPTMARNQVTLVRELPARLPSIVPEHGPTTIAFSDYVDAFSGEVPRESPEPTESLEALLEACIRHRTCTTALLSAGGGGSSTCTCTCTFNAWNKDDSGWHTRLHNSRLNDIDIP